MILTKNHSTLNTTKADTYRFKAPSAILRESITKISSKFSTSDAYYMLHGINLAIQNKKCRLKWIIKDEEYNRSEEVLQKYCQMTTSQQQLPELTEYYKYYTQTSILYQANFFKLMHQHRERRKVLEYNRLKILLNLSETQNTSQIEQKNKRHMSINSFYILSKLNVTNQAEESEIMIAKLSSKLEKTLGPNCYRTIEELDRNYHFQKKKVDTAPFEIHSVKRNIPTQDKENFNQTLKSSKIKHSKRNSCEIQQSILSKKADSKQKSLNKKKHYSMDNVNILLKDYQIRENKPKMYGNWMKNSQPCKQLKAQTRGQKGQTIKFRQRLSQQKFKSEQTEKDYDIRSKIIDTKQKIKIKKEKLQLKKKTTLTTNQSQIMKTTKKGTPLHVSPGQRHPNRKLLKIAFS